MTDTTDEPTECDCVMMGETPDSVPRCDAESPQDRICTKPENHDGPHSACNPAEHPAEVWE